MTPLQIGRWCSLYRADCHDLLPELRALEPAAVVTDPPYGLGLPGTAGYGRASSVYRAVTPAEERRGNAPIAGDVDRSVNLAPLLDLAPVSFVWGADHPPRPAPRRRQVRGVG